MYDILPPKGTYDVSRDLFSKNISLMVQDNCNVRLTGNRMWPIKWHHCQYPWNTLEWHWSHFCCL